VPQLFKSSTAGISTVVIAIIASRWPARVALPFYRDVDGCQFFPDHFPDHVLEKDPDFRLVR
jgi:hypothetical protein